MIVLPRLRIMTLFYAFTVLVACNSSNNSTVFDASVFIATERTVKTGLVDYGHHVLNPDYKQFIANSFDYIVTGEQDLDFGFFRNLNPDILIFSYWNSILLGLDQAQPEAEQAYLHDLSVASNTNNPAQRIARLYESDFYYVMDVGNTEWQSFASEKINQILGNGFDGINLDDVFAHLMHETHFNSEQPYFIGKPNNYSIFTTVPIWYSANKSHDDYRAFIAYISSNMSKKLIFNGINDVAEKQQPIDAALDPMNYLQVSDGSVQEGFVYNGAWVQDPRNGFLGDEYWQAIVDKLINIPVDKMHGVVSYGDPNYAKARLYSFASFLMGYKYDAMVSYYYAPNEFTLTYLPEWNLKLGKPIDTFSTIQQYRRAEYNIYQRRFENALIMVNPYSETTTQIALDGEYYLLKGMQTIPIKTIDGRIKVAIGDASGLIFVRVSSVQLEGYSAAILMKKP